MPRNIRKFGLKRINHVVIRGINKQDIFLDNQDKEKFIKEIKNMGYEFRNIDNFEK